MEAAAWHGNWKLTRFVLGAALGLAAGSLVANSVRRDVVPALAVNQPIR
jgi:predicted small secreted protein